MNRSIARQFREVWLCDFEFGGGPGERPVPRCVVAHEVLTGRRLRVWEDELLNLSAPPYPIHDSVLFVAYYASAEIGCHLALNWGVPENVLDLFTEFRNFTNGHDLPCGNSLLGALTYFGLDCIEATEKEALRQLAMRGGPWTQQERVALLDYCESDVVALARLLEQMDADIDTPRALLRGRSMIAAAKMEHAGVPIDTRSLNVVRHAWSDIKRQLVHDLDVAYGVFDGLTFKQDRFARYLAEHGMSWPMSQTGRLVLDDDTFRSMVRLYPELAPLHELRHSLSQLRLEELNIGADGRNRTILSAFRSSTGRNQPSNTRFIFGPATWIRGFIQPEPGHGLAYIDYDQQEWAIAAALSGDEAMLEAYAEGDAYLAFAKQSGTVPPTATKASHRQQREYFKTCALGVQYGMGVDTLASRLGQSRAHAEELLRLHRRLYHRYWTWSDAALSYAMLHSELPTVFGWTIHIGHQANPRSLRNFPIQANGAEMLRLACIYITEAGIELCAPVHDALLIHAPLVKLDEAVAMTREAMAQASADVLGGLRLRTDAKVVRYPDRYMDDRGVVMWNRVQSLVCSDPGQAHPSASAQEPVRGSTPVPSY